MDSIDHAKVRIGLVVGFLGVLGWQAMTAQAAPSASSGPVQFSSQELVAAVDSEVSLTPSPQGTSSSIADSKAATEASLLAVYGKLPMYF